ncbi:MAG TPA: SDR family oxidoreductase [Bryobacteraceae bacterium]|nr:SDR family oxidoreductase [Bryobacteraceae bacterium]
MSGLILITGASGRIGGRVAELLARDGQRLRLMTRGGERAPKLPGAETVRGDFAEPATLETAFAGASAALVVSVSGKPGERARVHRNAFEAAARARVGHVVYLSMIGAAEDSKYPYSRDHYQSEQYLFATGLPCTVLRDAFYLDMFLEKFDAAGVIRGPAEQGRGAFVSREDVARCAAAVLQQQPGGIYDVTGPEALSVAEIAGRLSALVGRPLRYENESADAARDRLSKTEPLPWRVDLSAGWFEAIAAGELKRVSDTVLRFTGTAPLTLEAYFQAFPELLHPLRDPILR